MTRRAVASVFLIAAVLLACPCAQADDALYEAAKKEGQVVWYTSLIVNQAVRPLVEAFNKKYPGVEVKYARGDSGPERHQGHQRGARRQGRRRCVRRHRHHGAVAQGRAGRAIHAVGSEQISAGATRSRWAAGMRSWSISSPRASTRSSLASTRSRRRRICSIRNGRARSPGAPNRHPARRSMSAPPCRPWARTRAWRSCARSPSRTSSMSTPPTAPFSIR